VVPGQLFIGEKGRTGVKQCPKTYLEQNRRSVGKIVSNRISFCFLLTLIESFRYHLDTTVERTAGWNPV
jgi:hypothetical protein